LEDWDAQAPDRAAPQTTPIITIRTFSFGDPLMIAISH